MREGERERLREVVREGEKDQGRKGGREGRDQKQGESITISTFNKYGVNLFFFFGGKDLITD